MNGSHLSGSASSGKIASTGHSGSHAPQSMHSSGSMTRIRSNSWMQSTGQTSMHDLSLMSMQGSAMMYVTAVGAYLGDQLFDELRRPLHERRFGHHLIEARFMRAAQAGGVIVVRVPEDRDVRKGVGNLDGIDSRDVRDHEVGRVDVVHRDEVVRGQRRPELAAEEEIDPGQQDRRHAAFEGNTPAVHDGLRLGLEQIANGDYFRAHESLEDVWRAAGAGREDLFP